jgi:hypothetical protein
MNVEIGTEAPIFLFWEYLFQIFGILSLQCILVYDALLRLGMALIPAKHYSHKWLTSVKNKISSRRTYRNKYSKEEENNGNQFRRKKIGKTYIQMRKTKIL